MCMLKIMKAVTVRAALLLHATMTVWRVTVDLEDDTYWLMGCTAVPFVIETLYTLIKRKGDDFLLFTPCFFFYLITTIPCVWMLELRKTDVYLSGEEDKLFNKTAGKVPLEQLDFGIEINPNTWTIMIEELLLYLLIVGRWVLPRGEVTREQLSELLFAFIGIASDTMEMFSLFGEPSVRSNRTLSYFILTLWSLSVSQFCMTLTVTHKPRKGKNIRQYDDNISPEKESASIKNEMIAILLSMAMQDVPFVTLRLYTIVRYNLITYSLIFFTAKNCLVICLLIYKMAVLIQKKYCPEKKKDDKIDDKELYVIGSDGNMRTSSKRHLVGGSGSGSDSGGSREKQKLERYYEENERDVRKRGKVNGHFVSDSPTLPARLVRSPNENTPLNRSKQFDREVQKSSTPASSKRLPTGTPRTPSSGPRLPPNHPRSTPSHSQKNLTKQPTQELNAQSLDTSPQQSPIAGGYGWISSKPKSEEVDDSVIVATLS